MYDLQVRNKKETLNENKKGKVIAVTILGNNSALPAHNRHPTSQIIQTDEHTFLVDCGEGTQMQMNVYKIRRSKINHIFISHLHGDHYFGLIGLLTSLGLNNRLNDLHVYAPAELETIIQLQLDASGSLLPYSLYFHVLENEGIIFEDHKFVVECFQVNHRISCWGFKFMEKKNLRKININQAQKCNIPTSFYEKLHGGYDYINPQNEVIKNDLVTTPHVPAKSYAYCADTAYFEIICEKIKGVDLIYHEATYLDDLQKKAMSRFHSTTKQAALIAQKSGAKRLIIGHFSSMYNTLENFKEEACEVFENSEIAEEGVCYLA
ncbi:MAG: ribonuclease Z [Bacteroidota bacterium]|nr:ribonuclease Z [Bacteroidota bacterium]